MQTIQITESQLNRMKSLMSVACLCIYCVISVASLSLSLSHSWPLQTLLIQQ